VRLFYPYVFTPLNGYKPILEHYAALVFVAMEEIGSPLITRLFQGYCAQLERIIKNPDFVGWEDFPYLRDPKNMGWKDLPPQWRTIAPAIAATEVWAKRYSLGWYLKVQGAKRLLNYMEVPPQPSCSLPTPPDLPQWNPEVEPWAYYLDRINALLEEYRKRVEEEYMVNGWRTYRLKPKAVKHAIWLALRLSGISVQHIADWESDDGVDFELQTISKATTQLAKELGIDLVSCLSALRETHRLNKP
jgi:hypothetical protein